ncbi:hypothetical protein CBG53_06495 [Porphyromonas gingivalis]|uniref:hypothetical protein n=1 Tax=Porphyromonas gingivalis TaxID=837 RepID=UPI0003AD7130|nr:hypothetical protein [Porphyromonas gingivalis]ERJ63769.1 hypothetical protein HMPREF1554_02256 [Porphyromonas gingivalis F0569]OWP29474.1 hypothetical protein CBG53_06495 [Porphyromonas gingivalis]OWR77686.1 hypothetical protein SJDPG11_07490 [Porphyromonas gingivalis SJD11]
MIQGSEKSNLEDKSSRQEGKLFQSSIIKCVQYISGIVVFLLVISLWFSPYNKTWAQDSICIPSDISSTKIDSLCEYNVDIRKIQFLKEMREKRELLTADEFAARITSYYNTLVAVLGTMFLLFTIATYFSMKQVFENKFEGKEKDIDKRQKQIEDDLKDKIRTEFQSMLRDSRSFREDLVDAVKGNIDGQFVTYEKLDDLGSYINDISEKQQDLMLQVAELQEWHSSQVHFVDESLEIKKDKKG